MKTFSNSLLLVRLVCSCVMLVALYLCLGAPVYAQTSCSVGDGGTNPNRGKGDDIQCRVNNVLNSNQALLNTVKAHAANCQGAHCDLLQDMVTNAQHAHDKAVKAHGRMKASDYEDLNNLRKEKCMGSRSACGQGNGTYSGGDSDPTVGQDVADNLDDATNALDKANKEMQDPQTASSLLATVPTAATDPSFQPVYSGDGSQPFVDPKYPTPFWMTTTWGSDLLNPYLRFATIIAVGVLDFVTKFNQDFCRQVLVVAGEGGNASAACAVFTIAYFAGKTTLDALNFEGSYTLSYATKVGVDNEAILNANIALVDAKAGNTEAAISALQAQVTALQTSVNALQAQLTNSTYVLSQKSTVNTDMDKQIMKLLLTPDGTRSLPASLLTCTGDSSTGSPCPPVAITCSATTGLCSFSPH